MASPTIPSMPLPPDVQAQQPSAPGIGMMMGATMPQAGDMTVMLKQKLGELESWASEMMQLLPVVAPNMLALLVPIAQAGKAMQSQIEEMNGRAEAGQGQGGAPPPPVGQPNPRDMAA